MCLGLHDTGQLALFTTLSRKKHLSHSPEALLLVIRRLDAYSKMNKFASILPSIELVFLLNEIKSQTFDGGFVCIEIL